MISSETSIQAGVIGLGAMGGPMARHLAAAGLLATVWNRTEATAEALAADLGVPVAESPEDLARRCNVVLTCVSADDDLKAVVQAMAPGLTAGDTVIDCSTVSPITATTLAAYIGTRKLMMIICKYSA